MEYFDPYMHVSTKYEANEFIANKLEEMQKIFNQCVLMAQEFNLRLDINFGLPDGTQRGHNQSGLYCYWSASSADC